jgi:hypothetical protein
MKEFMQILAEIEARRNEIYKARDQIAHANVVLSLLLSLIAGGLFLLCVVGLKT